MIVWNSMYNTTSLLHFQEGEEWKKTFLHCRKFTYFFGKMELQAGGIFQLSLLMFQYEIAIKSKFNLIQKISRKPLIAIIFIIVWEGREGRWKESWIVFSLHLFPICYNCGVVAFGITSVWTLTTFSGPPENICLILLHSTALCLPNPVILYE